MKCYSLLLLFVIGFVQSGLAQTASPFAPFVSPQAKEIYLQTHRNLPIEWHEVSYFTTDPNGGSLTPAYIDLGTMTAYSWAGVVLQPDQIPGFITQNSVGGLHLIFPHDPTKSNLQFQSIDPPTFYMLLPDGKYAEGYFDNGHGIYYRWGDLEFDKSQLPADAVSKNRILPLSAVKSSTIPPPSKDKQSPKAELQSPSNVQPSSTSDKTATTVPQLATSQGLKPLPVVVADSDTSIPWWLCVVVISFVLLAGAGYFLLTRK